MKRFALIVGLLLCVTAQAQTLNPIVERALITAQTSTGAGAWFNLPYPPHTVTCNVNGTGSVTATVVIEGAPAQLQVAVNTVESLTLTGTTNGWATATDVSTKFGQYRAHVTALTGTGAAVTCFVGS